jgi:hypothetical protein
VPQGLVRHASQRCMRHATCGCCGSQLSAAECPRLAHEAAVGTGAAAGGERRRPGRCVVGARAPKPCRCRCCARAQAAACAAVPPHPPGGAHALLWLVWGASAARQHAGLERAGRPQSRTIARDSCRVFSACRHRTQLCPAKPHATCMLVLSMRPACCCVKGSCAAAHRHRPTTHLGARQLLLVLRGIHHHPGSIAVVWLHHSRTFIEAARPFVARSWATRRGCVPREGVSAQLKRLP